MEEESRGATASPPLWTRPASNQPSPVVLGVTFNPSSFITACESVVATWQDKRRCQVVQVWVVAGMRTAVDMDFGPA